MIILSVIGLNDRAQIKIKDDGKGNFKPIYDGNAPIVDDIPLRKGILSQTILAGRNIQQRDLTLAQTPSLVINQISDPDINRGALERCSELCQQLSTRVINPPERIQQTARDRVSELLQDIPGVIMPRTVRCQPSSPQQVFQLAEKNGIQFPFICRLAGDHGGISMTLVRSKDDHTSLHAYPFDGRDFYITEFVDYQDSEGIYTKQRIIVIDGEPIARHSLSSKSWNVHISSRKEQGKKPSLSAREAATLRHLDNEIVPRWAPAISTIRQRLGIEYFGIDCHLMPSGNMLVFEANANMNVFETQFPEIQPRIDTIKKMILQMVAKHAGKTVRDLAL
jgi:glutathione synthase/RimK-type ligase-like ATP-grasp enzyme